MYNPKTTPKSIPVTDGTKAKRLNIATFEPDDIRISNSLKKHHRTHQNLLLTYSLLDKDSMERTVLANGSFSGNNDVSSQLRFMTCFDRQTQRRVSHRLLKYIVQNSLSICARSQKRCSNWPM